MRKKSAIIASAIAAIITTSVLAFTSNQAFAHGSGMQIFVRNGMGSGQTMAEHEAQAGKVLAGDLLAHTLPLTLTKSLTPPGLCQCFASVGGCNTGPQPCTGAKEGG